MTVQRRLLGLVVVMGTVFVAALWLMLRPLPHRVYDRIGLIPPGEERQLNAYLDRVQYESGVDIRVAVTAGLQGRPPEQVALALMRELEVGRENGGRGLLVLYDTVSRTMRIEVGPKLEGMLPDGFLSYLLRQHVDPVFGDGRPEIGLRTTLFMLHWRIRLARLGEEYDPSFEQYLRDVRGVARGGGATAEVTIRPGSPDTAVRPDSAARAYFRPQPTVQAAHERQLEWLALGCRDAGVSLYTASSRAYIRSLHLSPAFCAYLLANEYGRKFSIGERGDLAILYFTDDPFLSPHFFRRTAAGWEVDIVAEVANTQEAVGLPYTWRMRRSGDEFSRAFADRYELMTDMPTAAAFYRLAGGDNRRLLIRGDASSVESEFH